MARRGVEALVSAKDVRVARSLCAIGYSPMLVQRWMMARYPVLDPKFGLSAKEKTDRLWRRLFEGESA